jgi:hypothetical protein
MREVITNYDIPVSGNQLSKQELLVTLAFILEGNYNPGNRSYINFSKSRNRPRALNTIVNACEELGIQHYNVKDNNPYNVYYGGQTLKFLFARQGLIPSRFRWKQTLSIPPSWIGTVPNNTLEKLLEFTTDLLRNRDLFVKEDTACQIHDNTTLHESVIRFFKPIRPNIRIEYINSIKSACILGLSQSNNSDVADTADDISDLL